MRVSPVRVLPAAACVVALVAGAAGASPAATAAAPRLAATTVVQSSRSAWTTVVLPRDVSLADRDVWSDRVVTVAGRGRIVGIELSGARGRVHLSAYRYNFCYRPGCPADGPEMLTSAFNADDVRYGLNQGDGRTRLPAGRYHLLVVTDGAPVTVTLRLPGLSGRVALRPQAPARTTETTLTWTAPTPPTPVSTRFSGGTRATFDGHTGEVLSMLDVRHDYSVEEESGFCVYDGAAPPAYLRGCPGGGGVSIGFVGVATTAYRSRAWGSYAGLGDGSYAVGEYDDVTGAAHDPKGAIAAVTYPRGW